jgi:hypothetical protein
MSEIYENIGATVVKICPICSKHFIPSVHWMYKLGKNYYCRYNCYQQAGGDNGGYKNYVRKRATNIKHKE